MDEKANRYSKEQKIGLVLLSVFILLAVTLGLIQVRNTIYRPFALNTSVPPLIGKEVNTSEALRYRDTDNDGLNDFDELFIYSTSPYLADTDSDGISDYDEVRQGKNPNCAEGKVCGNVTDTASTLPDKPDQGDLFSMEDNIIPTDLQELYTPEAMRQILIESGLDESMVALISDEEINQMVTDILASENLTEEDQEISTETLQAIEYLNTLMAEEAEN